MGKLLLGEPLLHTIEEQQEKLSVSIQMGQRILLLIFESDLVVQLLMPLSMH
jgi:hypothetical protein